MYHNSVGVVGTGYYLPSRILRNSDLEKLVDTSDEWIRARTGIRERRIVSEHEAASDLAVNAGAEAMKSAAVNPDEIDLVIVATLSPDMLFPSTACIVQHKLGLKRAFAFDIEAACSGFLFALSIAEQYITNGTCKTVLVIGAEVFSRIVDWQDRNTCVLFGDGAGAVILQKAETGSGIISIRLGSDGSGADLLKLPAGGSRLKTSHETIKDRQHFIKMNGKEIYKFATTAVVKAIKAALDEQTISSAEIDLLIPHQANIRIIECIAEKLKIPMGKVFVNLDKYGNTSSASIPIALCEALEQNRIKKGDIIVFVGFGAGLTWGTAIIKW